LKSVSETDFVKHSEVSNLLP